jgi:two-component system, cell cycle sensor histidine kinase and response regulator CckA
MLSLLTSLFTTRGFEPHGQCFLWTPTLLWLYVLADGLVALAYYSIPLGLLYFVRRRKDLAFKPVFLMFGAFIVACGTTHLLGVWTLWHPDYWLDGSVKALTAVFSIGTAAMMWRVIPEALALPSPTQLATLNHDLQHEIAARSQTQRALEELNRTLLEAQEARSLFEGVPVGLYRSTPDGRFLDVNPALVRLLGYPDRVSLLAANVAQLHENPADRQRWQVEVERTGVSQGFEVAWRRHDGTLVWLRTHGHAVRDARGRVQYYEGVAEDITAHRRAEAELRESEERFRSTFEDASIGMALQDLTGQYLRVNAAFCRMVGRTEAELLAMSWQALTHPSDVEREIEQRLLAGDAGVSPVEKRYLHRDGHVVWASVSAALVRDNAGRALHFIVQAQDISARKQAEETLRDSEERYRLLAEHVTDVIWVFDRHLHLTYISPSVTRLRGYSVQEVLDQTLEERLTPASLAVAMAALREELEMEQQPDGDPFRARTLELELPRKDGSTVWTEMQISLLRDAEGRLSGFIGVSRDITERRRAEGMLRLQAAALDAAANAMIITDRQEVIQWVNPAFTTMTGYRAQEVVGRTPRVLKSGRHDREFYRGLWDSISAGQVWTGEMTNRRQDGTLYTENQTITPVRDAGGAITHFIAIKQDVTERKLLEDELRQAQKMEAIGRLAGGVAHDFNNLLTVILGRTALLSAHLPPEDRLRRNVDLIEHAGLRAAALTRQLLAFSRKQVLEPRVLDVPALLTALEPMLRRLIGEDIELVTASVPPVGRVKVDPGQLEQAVLNLVVNARDAMPRGGRLRVETTNVEMDAHYAALHPGAAPGPYVMLAVSDTGVGMDAATQARIFEPFFTTKGEHGTGLGLATVYGIVKQAGGTVRVYSEPGHGATFKIFLPRVAEMPAPLDAGADTPPSPGTETILLVEDEEALLHLTRETLANLGYTIVEARHGAEALLVAAEYTDPIHLLLTDVIMPQVSGRELAERLAATRPGLRVLYMSGYTAGAIEQHGVLEAGTFFLQKPFTPAQLGRKVREVLDMGT